MPTLKNKLGFIFWWKFGRNVPHILYDGIVNPDWVNADGSFRASYRICIGENENGSFANLQADKLSLMSDRISRSMTYFNCNK
jgi:hypothetical protein